MSTATQTWKKILPLFNIVSSGFVPPVLGTPTLLGIYSLDGYERMRGFIKVVAPVGSITLFAIGQTLDGVNFDSTIIVPKNTGQPDFLFDFDIPIVAPFARFSASLTFGGPITTWRGRVILMP